MSEERTVVEIVRQRLADGRTIADQMVRELLTEIGRLRDDNRLLACAYHGWTPDRYTQSPDEVAKTEAEIVAALDRAVPEAIVR